MYVEKLGILKAVIDELDTTCYAITGDWNANLYCHILPVMKGKAGNSSSKDNNLLP